VTIWSEGQTLAVIQNNAENIRFDNLNDLTKVMTELFEWNSVEEVEVEVAVQIPATSDLQEERQTKILQVLSGGRTISVKEFLKDIGESVDQKNIARWYHSFLALEKADIIERIPVRLRNGSGKPTNFYKMKEVQNDRMDN
jgi:hypothetical protein